MFKAIVISKSPVDARGFVEVAFDIYDGEDGVELLYQNVSIFCPVDSIQNGIKDHLTNLKAQIDASDMVQIGDEIVL